MNNWGGNGMGRRANLCMAGHLPLQESVAGLCPRGSSAQRTQSGSGRVALLIPKLSAIVAAGAALRGLVALCSALRQGAFPLAVPGRGRVGVDFARD